MVNATVSSPHNHFKQFVLSACLFGDNKPEDGWKEFDEIIGLDRLKAIHLNDSKNPMGSHKDRHEKIGEGTLTLEGITRIINHPKLIHLPFYLETPNEAEGYAREIALLRDLRKND